MALEVRVAAPEQRAECLPFPGVIVRPKRGEILAVPHAVQKCETHGVGFRAERVAFDVVEEVAVVRSRHQIEPLAAYGGAELEMRLARLA